MVVIDGTNGIDTVVDGSIGTNDLASNAVTTAKILDGAITPAKTQMGATPSMVRVNTANGYGSTATKIRRFTNVVTNQGSDITYADSAANGASFTINTAGVYAISYSDFFTADTSVFGVSINASSLTTALASTTLSEVLTCMNPSAGGYVGCCSVTAYLSAGSVLRPHSSGGASTAGFQMFTITRVA